MKTPRRIGLALEFQLVFKHHTEVFAGVVRFANERGWITIVDDWIGETLKRSPSGCPAYDGIIARVDRPRLGIPRMAERYGVPLVNVFGGSPVADRVHGVFSDFEQAGRIRAEHLLSRGLRNFAALSSVDRVTCQRQADAFGAAIAEAGHTVTRLDLPEYLPSTPATYRRIRKLVEQWMDRWVMPIGVALPGDDYARQIAQIAAERGWRVPEDVAIVGGMNEDHLCENPRPTLTSVEMGFERVGYEAARLLESLMDSPRSKEPKHVRLPPVGIVVRESTDFYASGDDIVSQAQAFIASQCHTHLDVGDVAENVCVSIRTLQNRFREVLHRTVGQEILRVRLERVKRELTGSDRSIQEIASRAGFPSKAKLSTVFRREVGMSPRDFRASRTVPPRKVER